MRWTIFLTACCDGFQMYYFYLYLAAVNLAAFAAMGLDKRRAQKGRWRVRERTLFLLALLGGSVGSLAGMRCFRHKTKHRSFVFGVPGILALQAGLGWFLVTRLS